MRGQLDSITLAKIEAELPEMITLYKLGLPVSPFIPSVAFEPESSVPVATICLNDVCTILNEARVAIIEARANLVWYRECSPSKRKEVTAVWCARFYVGDAAFRLYAAGEHLAAAIVTMLEIDEQELKNYTSDRNTSAQSKVGKLMLHLRPDHPISHAIMRLQESPEWSETIGYRNNYVHEQPPTLEGVGVVYKRGKRWKKLEDSHVLSFGGWDEPEYSIDDLLRTVTSAFSQFRETLVVVADSYRQILVEAGITEGSRKQSAGGEDIFL